MVYSNINPKFVGKPRCEKKEIKIKGCMLGHLFVYEPNSTEILMNEYLCDFESCLNLEFSSCKKPVASFSEIGNDFLEECMVRRSTVACLWVCEHAILCESAFVQCQWSCILRTHGEKGSSHWEITRSVWSCYSSWRIVSWRSIFA